MMNTHDFAETATPEAIRDHYDRLSGFYQALWGEHIHHGYWEGEASPRDAQVKLIQKLAEQAQIRQGDRVLDVGGGLGGSAFWLAQHLGCTVRGVTLSPVQAAMARRKAAALGLSHRVHVEVQDASHLALEPESFDAVWVVECCEHLADKARFFANCARVLRPGGRLALCTWLSHGDLSPNEAELVNRVCRGMLCPSLASLQEHIGWISQSGLGDVQARDITRHVEPTWAYCLRVVKHPAVRTILRLSDGQTRRFVNAFAAIQRAYATGAMRYGMFSARKAGP